MHPRQVFLFAAMSVVSVTLGSLPARAQCLDWKPGFNLPGIGDAPSALTVFDDGTGPALYAAGGFRSAGNIAANSVAKWNGSSWSALGTGMDAGVSALAVFDDGTGAALYAGGYFRRAGEAWAPLIAKWDGSAWSTVGAPFATTYGYVSSLAVFDDGTGAALYILGTFDVVTPLILHDVAKWNGSVWTPVGSGFGQSGVQVHSTTVFDDGSGPELFVGGTFVTVDGVVANGFAKWDGSSWTGLGSAFDGTVYALTVFDDGSGDALFVGGNFTTVAGVAAGGLARWDGAAWTGQGTGLGATFGTPSVEALQGFDNGAGPILHVSGFFHTAGGSTANGIAGWNGSSWSTLSSGLNDSQDRSGDHPGAASAFEVFDDGSGPALYVAGRFDTAGGVTANHLARWSGSTWTAIGPGRGLLGSAHALAFFDDGSGRALFASTSHRLSSGNVVGDFVKWDGTNWSQVGGGVSEGGVASVVVHDDGFGPALYAGGTFTSAGGLSARRIARWDGQAWSPLGSGMETPSSSYVNVEALRSFDDGTGAALYAGGYFTVAGGVEANYIARWDGASWSALGSGLDGSVTSLEVFDDGTGPALFAGGYFNFAGGSSAHHIAKWDGTNWSSLGSGTPATVRALATVDLGSGPNLFVGGDFTSAGATMAHFIARWNGSTWASLGAGSSVSIYSLAGYDDGWGMALYAGGVFKEIPMADRPGITKWNGSTWMALGSGVSQGEGDNHFVYALAAGDLESDGALELYVGGNFGRAGVLGSSGIAAWLGCVSHGTPVCVGDGTGAPCPCGNSGWPGSGCNNAVSSGGARLNGRGAPSLGADSLSLDCTNLRPNVLCLVFQGDQQIAPVFDGDGLRCAAGHVKRLYAHGAFGSSLSVPAYGDPTISARSAALGDPLFAGAQRIYQVYYRDKSPTFCPSPQGNTWNISSGLRVEWIP